MIRRIALLAPPLLGMACSPGPDGIWLLEVPWEDGGGCETSITEDFTAGYVPGEAAGGRSDWTYSDSYEGADSLRFVQIETYGDGTAVLVVGDEAYPGVQAEDSWVFSFEKKTTETDSADHASGYFWEIVQTSQSDSTYTFSFQSRERAEVEVEASSTTTVLWQESDEWDIGTVGVGSQLDFEDYIVYDDPDSGQRVQENDWETDDCEGGSCELRIVTSCNSSGELTAALTDYENSDYYDYLTGVGQ